MSFCTDHKMAFDRQMVHDMFVALTTTAPGLCLNDMKSSLIQVCTLPSTSPLHLTPSHVHVPCPCSMSMFHVLHRHSPPL